MRYFGAISEKMNQELEKYLKTDCMMVREAENYGKVLKSKFRA